MNNYTTMPILDCINFNHLVKKFCLPIKTACNNTVIDGLFVECGQQWSCNKVCATDVNYNFPVPTDGTLMFQTNFRLPTTAIWGTDITIKLFDLQDEEIEIEFTEYATRYVVGSDGKVGYQTIEIDFSEIPIDCGYFIITADETDVCTQYFEKKRCANLVEIESIVKEFDCWNNYYGLSKGDFTGTDFNYSNKIYLEGSTKYFGTNVSDKTITELLRFTPMALVAPFMAKYITFKFLKEKNILIDGELWKTKDTQLTAREKSNMFWTILEFDRTGCSDKATC